MNILIVDDEAAILSILRDYIAWDSLGIDQVFTAYNAFDARNILLQETVHIVICDIEMPQESGLHFLAWVKEQYPDITKIILTGYPNFTYAQGAIDIGVFKYLLKPVSFEELSDTVRFVVEERKARHQAERAEILPPDRKRAEKNFYRDLIEEEILPFERHIEGAAKNRGIDLDENRAEALVYLRPNRKGTGREPDSVLYFALGNIAEELFADIVELHIREEIFWVVKRHKTAEELAKMCELFLKKLKDRLPEELNAYFEEEVGLTTLSEKANALRHAAGRYHNIGQHIYHVRELYDGQERENGEDAEGGSLVWSGQEAIRQVKEYVKAHVGEPINRKDMENAVHLNGDYLNRIFKAATGYSLVQYIQYYKILESKRLLHERREATIAEIALQVGFDTPSYFAKIFRKWTDMTPNEYQMEVQGKAEGEKDA